MRLSLTKIDSSLLRTRLQKLESTHAILQELRVHLTISKEGLTSKIEHLVRQADAYIWYVKAALDGRVKLSDLDNKIAMHGIERFSSVVENIGRLCDIPVAIDAADQIYRSFQARARIEGMVESADDTPTLGMTG